MAKTTKATAKPAKTKAGGKKGGSGSKRGSNAAGAGGDGRALTTSHNNGSADAVQANFLSHRTRWIGAMSKLKVAEKDLKDMVAAAKADGFLKKQFQIADQLTASAKKEAKVVGEVTTRLQVARWIGHALGKQFDLFENPAAIIAATPPSEAAYANGKQAALEGKTATPPGQFSSQDLSEKWLAGYHDTQAQMVRKGIKQTQEEGGGDVTWAGGEHAEDDGSPAKGWGASTQGAPQTVN